MDEQVCHNFAMMKYTPEINGENVILTVQFEDHDSQLVGPVSLKKILNPAKQQSPELQKYFEKRLNSKQFQGTDAHQ